MSFPADGLKRLAGHILEGDVVFFIGTGCSIDSESNTAARLMWRLLLRVVAFAKAVGEDARVVLDDLRTTFGLKGNNNESAIAYCSANADKLARRYYESNDWFCDAFAHLLEIAAKKPHPEQILADTQRFEEELRAGMPEKTRDPVPFDTISPGLLRLVSDDDGVYRRAAGKALFLDTMGFRHDGVMGGRPRPELDLDAIENSYSRRLLPRHHVLAWLAREGLCNTLITTNFDLLLEGAYFLSGFSNPRKLKFPATLVSEFDVIASPHEFFTKGKAYRTAVIVKMHGCAQRYRDLEHSELRKLCEYLRSMVFTYREIQNWRDDSWAADYLRTLLRTRVVVFCGYSLQDPVIHDTFRTVYEEMRRTRRASDLSTPSAPAPAFFFAPGDAGTHEFHGMAVLQAASDAVGATRTVFGSHPNYLRFHLRNKPEFPNLDELMCWLFHLTFRARQAECLVSDLRRISTLLIGGQRPESELEAVRTAFAELRGCEESDAKAWETSAKTLDNSAVNRRQYEKHCAWTTLFHVGLLREFACDEIVRQRQGASLELGLMRRFAWYYPAMQDASWTCWGAVVELALRRMARSAKATLCVADCRRPTLFVQEGSDDALRTPHALTIQFGGFERIGFEARLHGYPHRRVFWELHTGDAPWPRTGTSDRERRRSRDNAVAAPNAEIIWRWASQVGGNLDAQCARTLLGFL